VAGRQPALENLGVSSAATTAFWRDRPTLVTGGSGLVGGWLVRRLVEAGADLVCLIRDWVPQSELNRSGLIDKVKTVRGDVRDQRTLERLLGEYEIDTVLHLAAQTIVPIANRNPISTFETNVAGSWTVLEACRRSPAVKQVVVASSDKSYGEQQHLPYDEGMPLQGRHPYDASKSAGDLITQSYAASFGLPVIITRCGNFYGGGDLNWSRIVPGTIRSIVRGKRPVIRSDGQFVRDYFYVEDGAAAYTLAAERLAEDRGLAGEAFNFSNEQPINVIDITRLILKLMDSDLEPEIRNEATNEIRSQYLSASKAREKLGWSPMCQLDEGLRQTIQWYRRFFGAAE
jgi:CDP-glucose 4,6-dehydratase